MGRQLSGAFGIGVAMGYLAFKLNLGWFDAGVIGLIVAGSLIQLVAR